MARKKTVNTDTAKLREALALIPEGRQVIGDKLLTEIVFMAGILDGLRQTITEEGASSPAIRTYNTTIQRYALLYKQFTDLLPKQGTGTGENALLDFIRQA